MCIYVCIIYQLQIHHTDSLHWTSLLHLIYYRKCFIYIYSNFPFSASILGFFPSINTFAAPRFTLSLSLSRLLPFPPSIPLNDHFNSYQFNSLSLSLSLLLSFFTITPPNPLNLIKL
nr:hypothetical protein Iba_chr10aCG1640 [Ipomoea batatas]GMD42901.1 hypothetical protein Iba_chr10cCG0160 [Ipomoea batatas]GME20840.1 hypothetical protein Iba_scaffold26250CG0020 [Ipomoea batatas]